MSLTLNQNPNGTLHIGKIVAEFHITAGGELIFPAGSRSRALAIVEALDQHINQAKPLEVRALPAPTQAAAVPKPVEEEAAPTTTRRPAKDGSFRGRPPKARG